MFRFEKTTAKAEPKDTTVVDRVTGAVLSAQHKAADYLNRKTAGWSPLKTKVILILFCLVTGNMILFIAARAILSANGPPKNLRVERLIRPMPLLLPGEGKSQPANKH